MKIRGKLLGFRSFHPVSITIGVLYYVSCMAVLFFGFTTPPLVPAQGWDLIVHKISVVVIVLWMLSPAIFLSETKIRNTLPLFKQRIKMKTLIGMMIVFLIFTYLFAMVESWHSPEYKTALNAYNEALYVQFYKS